MKMPRKVVITSLTLLSAITLAGSISGTLAWYQYSTRATVAYEGTTVHCSKLLQLSVDNGNNWGSDIRDLPSASFVPVTTGAQDKDAALPKIQRTVTMHDSNGNPTGTQVVTAPFYAQPDRGQGLYDNWLLAGNSSYAQIDILIKVKDVNGEDTEKDLENDVYLTDLTIVDADESNHLDLSSAVRVHISTQYQDNGTAASKNFLFAKETEDTEVGGFLDLDEDGEYDQVGYEWNRHTCLYGDGTFIPATYDEEGNKLTDDSFSNAPHQYSYKADDEAIIADEVDNVIVGGTPIGKTSATNGEYLKVTVTIWLEGWSPLLIGAHGTQDSSIWDEDSYLSKQFNVGMTFGVQLHNDNE